MYRKRFGTSSFPMQNLFQAAADYIQQFIRNRLLATLVILLRQVLNQLVGIVRSGLHGKHTSCMFGSIRVQQNRINLLAQYFRKKVGYQPGCGRLYNIIIIEVALSGGFRRFFGHLIQVDRQILISRQDLRPGRFE